MRDLFNKLKAMMLKGSDKEMTDKIIKITLPAFFELVLSSFWQPGALLKTAGVSVYCGA